MTTRAAVTALFAIALLGACATAPEAHPLTGTRWQLVSIDTTNTSTPLDAALRARHTIAFGAGGELQAQLDCNRGRSSWTADEPRSGAGAISFGPLAGTKMGCPAPSFGNALAGVLGQVERYTITPDGRKLVLETKALNFTFAPDE
jgi:heat shock protein HslJ